MGRVGLLPRFFGHVHPEHRTPSYAIFFQGCVTLALALIAGLLWGTLTGFAVLASTLTIGAMKIYTLGNVALPVFYLKEHRNEFSITKHLLFPLAAVGFLVYVLYRTVWPVPPYPLNVPAYVAMVWVAVAAAAVIYMASKKPDAMAKAGLLAMD
jgi:amino acid transporter